MKRIEGRIEKLEQKFGVHDLNFKIVILQGSEEEKEKQQEIESLNAQEDEMLIFISGVSPNEHHPIGKSGKEILPPL